MAWANFINNSGFLPFTVSMPHTFIYHLFSWTVLSTVQWYQAPNLFNQNVRLYGHSHFGREKKMLFEWNTATEFLLHSNCSNYWRSSCFACQLLIMWDAFRVCFLIDEIWFRAYSESKKNERQYRQCEAHCVSEWTVIEHIEQHKYIASLLSAVVHSWSCAGLSLFHVSRLVR